VYGFLAVATDSSPCVACLCSSHGGHTHSAAAAADYEPAAGRLAELEDFVDFLRPREDDRALPWAAQKASEPALAEVWEDVDDADFDRL
jgi:hypothetical protein